MTEYNVLISVIMPAYNEEKFIGDAIESILDQTFSDFELIIIDDGSEDQTKTVVKKFDDKRIKLIELNENKGNSYAANVGLKNAQGKYIARCDADDISLKYRLERQYDLMEQRPDIGYCGGGILFFGNQSGKLFYPVNNDEMKVLYLFGNAISQGASMLKKEIITENNLYYDDEGASFAEDYNYFFKLSQYTKGHNLNELLIKYRRHDNNISINIGSEKTALSHEVLRKVIEYYFFIPTHDQLITHDFLRNANNKDILNDFSLKSIYNWLKLLLHENKNKKKLNQFILRKYLYQKWDRLFYILVDKKKLHIGRLVFYFWVSRSFSSRKIYYYIKSFIKPRK